MYSTKIRISLNNISYQLFNFQPLNLKNEIMSTRAILAGIAGAVFAFFLGWLIFGILLMDYYTANTTSYPGLMKEMPNLVLIFLSQLIMGLLFAFIFERWAGIKTFGRGIVGGIILGFKKKVAV